MRVRRGKTASIRSQMVKFSRSLVAMEAMGIRSPQYLGYSMRKAGPILFLSLLLSFPDLKMYLFTFGLTARVFHPLAGSKGIQTHDFNHLTTCLSLC